jgi:hypothetical protein
MSTEDLLQKRFARLGELFLLIGTWTWITIFLWVLVFPIIVQFVLTIRLLVTLNDIRQGMKDDSDLEKAIANFAISPLLLIIALLTAVANWRVGLILLLAALIVHIIAWSTLSTWSEKLARQTNTPNIDAFAAGIARVKLGFILAVLGIGLILIPLGLKKAGKGVLAELQPNAVPQPPTNVPSPPNTVSQAPAGPSTEAPSENNANGNCPHCGAALAYPGIKFCGKCGQRIQY